ncbi:MAG: FCD domain-containing protein [Alphaproteobacteria bacterium]|nr:FCD domain-containing protein [Alphaproteobacteria bacterium]
MRIGGEIDGMTDERIRKKKLSEEVGARLERDIADGVLRVGDFLPSERALMTRFGVGRPSVREALFALEKKGLVTLGSGARARVCAPDPAKILSELSTAAQLYLSNPEGLRSMHDLRTLLETGLAREAARRATPADIARLRERLLANEKAIGDRDAFEATDNELHLELARICGNPLLVRLHAVVVDWLAQQRDIVLRYPEIGRIAYEHHEAIYNAIATHNPDRAEEAIRASLNTVDRAYWSTLAKERPQDSERALPQ